MPWQRALIIGGWLWKIMFNLQDAITESGAGER